MTIKPLSLLVRRHRRLLYALIAWYAASITASVVLAALSQHRLWLHLWGFALIMVIAVAGPLATLAALAFTGRLWQRATELELIDGNLRAPLTLTKASQYPVNATIIALTQGGILGPMNYRSDDVSFSAVFACIYGLALAVSATLLWRAIRRGSHEIRLTPDGLRLPRALGSTLVPWTQVRLRGATYSTGRRKTVTIHLTPIREVVLYPGAVDPRFLATAICYYTEFPEERAAIGTHAGYAHLLRVLGVTPQPIGAES